MMNVRERHAGKRAPARGWFLVFLLAVVPPLPAADLQPPRGVQELLAIRLQAVGRDSPEWDALMAEGRARTDFCARCHGQNGISLMPLVPNLAGQSPYYLLEQIERFADGRRKDFIMTPLARQFGKEDKVAVAFYYANLPARTQAADSALVGPGKELYGQRCVACHGQNAHGGDMYARLAGQHPDYLKRRLAEFRGADGPTSVMTEVARTLSDKDIERIAAYLSSQP